MAQGFTKFLFGVCFIDAFVLVNSLKCFEHACNGTNCLSTEVVNNPLLIKKCERVIYKGCYTVTTAFSEFSMTTAGCVDKQFTCTAGTCSGTFVTTKVTCCNTDLCNDGIVYSHSDTNMNMRSGVCFVICVLINILCLRK